MGGCRVAGEHRPADLLALILRPTSRRGGARAEVGLASGGPQEGLLLATLVYAPLAAACVNAIHEMSARVAAYLEFELSDGKGKH